MGLARCSGLTSNRANVLMLFPEAPGDTLAFLYCVLGNGSQSAGHEVHVGHETESKRIFSRQAATIVFLLVYLKVTVHWKSACLERLIVVDAIAVIKQCPGQLVGGRAYVTLKLQMGWHVSQQWARSRSRELAESSHCKPEARRVRTGTRRVRTGMVWVFKLSKTASCDTPPTVRPHLLNLPKQCHQPFNHPSLFGDISFKPAL